MKEIKVRIIKWLQSKFNTENKYYWLYLVGFFLILALPILNLPPWFSPPDWGKTIIFRIILSILIFLFIWRSLSEKKLSIKTSLPFWILLALFGVFLLATIFSQDPVYSLLGDPHRAGGFLNFGFYIIFGILAFLVLRKQDWQKIWIFAIFIGVLVSIIAIFQRYSIFTEVFVPVKERPFSFVGSSVLLGLYLVLLVFITFSFLIKEQKKKEALFYFLALSLFLYTIFLTGSRAAYFGLAIGFIYFILCYPNKQRIVVLLKVLFVTLLILGVQAIYYINIQQKLPDYSPNFLQQNKVVQQVLPRLSYDSALENPRFSVWLVSLEAIKERPILGYGPENFSIAFDKYYDPSMPLIDKTWGSWYDKAHNFLFDISITAGIPALIIFISLFAVLFYKLQKVKERHTEDSLICHGIQATFLAYLSANLFVFDSFSSYLVLFLLIAYSLNLLPQKRTNEDKKSLIVDFLHQHRNILIFSVFFCLIWFIWSLNLKPLIINKQANIALQSKDENCEHALAQMEKPLSSHSFLDHYLGMKYANIINSCIKKYPDKSVEMAQDVIQILERNTEIRPTYTRNWLYLGIYTNFLIEKGLASADEADYYFKKANELSSKKQEIFNEWAKTYFITNNYSKAKEKAQQCIELNPIIGECWWIKGISNIYLNNIKQAKIDLQIAKEKGYDVDSKVSLFQLLEAYLEIKSYEELIEIHEKLIELEPDNAQYYATLAYNYKVIGNYEKAKETAEKMLELFPEMKEKVEEFLKSLPR